MFTEMLGSTLATVPSLDAITFPIDLASIGTAIGLAGAALLAIVVPLVVGFKIIWKLIRRGTTAV